MCNSSQLRVRTDAIVAEALRIERLHVAAEEARRRELASTNLGQIFLLIQHAETFSGSVRCPAGHPGHKDNACIHMNCTAPECSQPVFCYACGLGQHACGCDNDSIYLHRMPGYPNDGAEALILFHFNRARAFVQVVKVLVLATPALGEEIWAQLQVQHPNLLSNIHREGNGNHIDWNEQQSPAELFPTFGNADNKARRLRAQLTEFERGLRQTALDLGLALVEVDDAILGLGAEAVMTLRDGTPAAVDVRVVAIRNGPNYEIGHTGVICRLEPQNPVVRWDHNGMEIESDCRTLNLTDMRLRDDTPAATGMRVVAIGNSQYGNYFIGCTGVICSLGRRNPLVRWDHSDEENESNCQKLNFTSMVLEDGTPAACGVRVIAIGNENDNYVAGQTGVICKITQNNPVVLWDHSGLERPSNWRNLNFMDPTARNHSLPNLCQWWLDAGCRVTGEQYPGTRSSEYLTWWRERSSQAVKDDMFLYGQRAAAGVERYVIAAYGPPVPAVSMFTNIQSQMDGGRYLDIADGRRLIIWDGHDGDNQKFSFLPRSNGFFSLYNPASGMVVEVQEDGETLGMANESDQQLDAQCFRLLSDGRIVHVSSGKCLDVSRRADNNCTAVILWDKDTHNDANQRWTVVTCSPSVPKMSAEEVSPCSFFFSVLLNDFDKNIFFLHFLTFIFFFKITKVCCKN